MVSLRTFEILLASLLLSIPLAASDQKPSTKEGWLEVRSSHFSIVTDAGEKRGREVVLRLEQMRAVFGSLLMRDNLKMPVPLEVLALKSDKDFEAISPLRKMTAIPAPAFFLAGEDKNFILLNLSGEEPWRAIAHPFAHMMLDGNYPPTQAWFDEGFAEYFGSIRVDNKTVDIGGDPELASKYTEDLVGNINEVRNPPKSLTELLSGPLWLNMADFLQMRLITPPYQEGTHHTLFYAQSWMLVHYLLAKKMLPQVGSYFNLVQNQKLPVEPAVQQAFGMSPEQLEKAAKDYFQSLTPLFITQDRADQPAQTEGDIAAARNVGPQVYQFSALLGPDDIVMTVKKIIDDDAHALVAEVMARQPEHREQGIKNLQALTQEPADNEIAHRALAHVYIEQKDFKHASDELQEAFQDDPKDAWLYFYQSVLRFRIAESTGQTIEGGLANVQQGLKFVIDWDPEFVEAYHLLSLAELEGGGVHAALDTMRTAIELGPRKEWYLVNLADIYFASKQWDKGQAILERLKASSNPQLASVARKKLDDLPFLKKYGITPERAAEVQKKKQAEAAKAEEEADAEPHLKERPPDKRPVQFLKGKIVSVNCAQAPVAILTVTSAAKTLKLRTADYKALVLVGADQFSCDWHNRPAAVNYKARGKSEGDLVSLEVQ